MPSEYSGPEVESAPSDHKDNSIAYRCNTSIEPSELVSEDAARWIAGDNAHSNLRANNNKTRAMCRNVAQSGDQPVAPGTDGV